MFTHQTYYVQYIVNDLYINTESLCFVDVLEGYNGTIFAYGQTSSGKTHTMEVRITFDVYSQFKC